MKTFSIFSISIIMFIVASCNKDQLPPYGNKQVSPPARKVRYELYTNENFKDDQENIQFRLYMGTHVKAIFDSSLAEMKIKDIPDFAHRIVIEKYVPGNDTSSLTVGFLYEIENVGRSWNLDVFQSADTFKLLSYPFK